ncbi:MAG: hypothetical protein A2017_18830 [Lentisphaerae bacterium GWF2_44_16]|nr:MAG: hypothetical protein A2017_18830 [Lentisphaerae bacterium GWF2_44_16]
MSISKFFLFLFLLFAFIVVHGEDKALDLLKKGWSEYEFREFAKAEEFFKKAEKSVSTPDEYAEALTGQAFCYQFAQKNQVSAYDYEYAISLYKKGLEKTGENHKLSPFLKSMIAECEYRVSVMEDNPQKLAKAEATWDYLRKNHPDSVVTQDAMLLKAVSQTQDFTDEATTENIKLIEAYLKPFTTDAKSVSSDKTLLAAPMCYYLYNCLFWRGAYSQSINWLKAYCFFGPTSYAMKSQAYFTIARISEQKLKDTKTALEYYKRIDKEIENSNITYYVKEKIASLKDK